MKYKKCGKGINIQNKFEHLIEEGDSLNSKGMLYKTAAYEKYKKALNLNFFNEYAKAGMYRTYISVESKLHADRFVEGIWNPAWVSAEISLLEGDTGLAVLKLTTLKNYYYSFYPDNTNNDFLKGQVEEIGFGSYRNEFMFFLDFIRVMDKASWESSRYTARATTGAIGFGFSYAQRTNRTAGGIEISVIHQNTSWGNIKKSPLNPSSATYTKIFLGYRLIKVSAFLKTQLLNNFIINKSPYSLEIGVGLGTIGTYTNGLEDEAAYLNLDDFSGDNFMGSVILDGKARISKKHPYFLYLSLQYYSLFKPISYRETNYSLKHLSNRLGFSFLF